jgi:uncharacterized protein (UPF0276 family)
MKIRADYPLCIHGVGLSIGTALPLDKDHLARLKRLIDRYQPALFSEHLAWSSHGDVFLNDLLPLPYNETTLARVSEHVHQIQNMLGFRILLENPSSYLSFASSTISEIEFLSAIVERTGCGLLLDVTNVFVSGANQGFNPMTYIDDFPAEHVGEIHLAGFAEDADRDGGRMLIDRHGSGVTKTVWSLYRRALARVGPVPTLIEWDNDVPPFPVLAGEVARAQALLDTEARRRSRRLASRFLRTGPVPKGEPQ